MQNRSVHEVLAQYSRIPRFSSVLPCKPGVVACPSKLSIRQEDAGGSGAQDHPQVRFQDNLGYVQCHSKNPKTISNMAQQVRVLAAKPDNPRLNSRDLNGRRKPTPKSSALTFKCAVVYANLCTHSHKNAMKIKSKSYLNAIFLDALH